tara:strand:+ start:1919 stop:2302 length:384 start_codon:yes stop_codon:yes gene_type:complete
MMIGTMSAASIVIVMMSMSSVPNWVDVVRASLVVGNPLFHLSEPRTPLLHLIREGDTGVSIVNLLTAEALIASHEGLTRHAATGTLDRLFIVVVCHDVFLSCSVWVDPIERGAFHPFVMCVFYQIRD